MADSRTDIHETAEIGATVETRRQWEAPTISRLSAGAAEVGYEANVSDGTYSQS